MPPGSFLTYRICNLSAESDSGTGSFAADGVHCLQPSAEVTGPVIHGWYFSAKDGKAGAIKKRGDVTRLQLGWLDRLYSGALSGAWRPSVAQGDPLLLEAADGNVVLDHLLVPWLVTLQQLRAESGGDQAAG
eukprot:UN4726